MEIVAVYWEYIKTMRKHGVSFEDFVESLKIPNVAMAVDLEKLRVIYEFIMSGETGIVPMLLYCPECGKRHLDTGKWANHPHHTHACQYCGANWRPAVVDTVGVQFLPGFKNDDDTKSDA